MSFNLDISRHATNQMVTALLYKRLSDFLGLKGKKELFSFIKSLKISGSSLTIKTEKPIVNSELSMFKSEIEQLFISSSANFGIVIRESKVSFK